MYGNRTAFSHRVELEIIAPSYRNHTPTKLRLGLDDPPCYDRGSCHLSRRDIVSILSRSLLLCDYESLIIGVNSVLNPNQRRREYYFDRWTPMDYYRWFLLQPLLHMLRSNITLRYVSCNLGIEKDTSKLLCLVAPPPPEEEEFCVYSSAGSAATNIIRDARVLGNNTQIHS